MSKSKHKKKGAGTKSAKGRKTVAKPNYKNWLILGGLLLITLLVYLPSLNNGWTNWDDQVYVLENIYLQTHDWMALLTQSFSSNYHPLTMISLGIDHVFWGEDAFGYHLTNLIFHLCATGLVFVFVRRLAPERSWLTAAFTALIFGIHPLHVESVAWISERKDVLYCTFFVGGLISYLRYIKKLEKKYLYLAFLLFLLSVLSKAMAVVFPVILILIDWYRQDRPLNKMVLLEKIPFFIVSLGFGVAASKIQAQSAIADFESLTIFQRIMFAAYGFIMYLVKAIVPFQLATFYPYPTAVEASTSLYTFMPILAAIVVITPILLHKKIRPVVFGILFYLITVALVLQFVSVGRAIMADRYSYIPYIGVFFGIGYYLDQAKGKMLRTGVLVGAGIFAIYLITVTRSQIGVWKDSETLWTQVLNEYPDKALQAWVSRGRYRVKQGRYIDALSDIEIAQKINPDDASVYDLRGTILARQGKLQESLPNFNKAIQLDAEKSKFFQNRAINLAQLNRYKESEADFKRALELKKGKDFKIHMNRGIMYLNAGRPNDAMSDCSVSYKLKPDDPINNYCLAQAYFQLGNIEEARRYAIRATQLGYRLPPELKQKLGL